MTSPEALGALDKEWGYGVHEWEDALDDFYDEHEYVNTDAKARLLSCSCSTRSTRTMSTAGTCARSSTTPTATTTGAITGTIDLDATQSSGEVVFFDYAVTND